MLRLRNQIWYYQTKINGRSWARSTGTSDRSDAQKVVDQTILPLLRLLKQQPERCLTLSAAIPLEVQTIEADVSPAQAARVSIALLHFLAWKRDTALERIRAEDLDGYQIHRTRQGISRETLLKEIAYIRRLLRRRGFDLPKPRLRGAPAKPNRAFTPDELLRFFTASTPRYRRLWLLLLATGARLGEFAPTAASTHVPILKREVDLEQRTLTIRASKSRTGEPRRARAVRVPEEIVPVLHEQLQSTPASYPYLFEKVMNAKRGFDIALRRAGLAKVDELGQKLTVHSLRHTYATWLGGAVGGNAWLVQAALGHASVRTSEIYCKPVAPPIPMAMGHLIAVSESQRGTCSQSGSPLGACPPTRGVKEGCQVVEIGKEKSA